MTKVIRIHRHGGPEVMQWEDADVGDPGPGEVRIRHTAVGRNFVDIYHRAGQFGTEAPPRYTPAPALTAENDRCGGWYMGRRWVSVQRSRRRTDR